MPWHDQAGKTPWFVMAPDGSCCTLAQNHQVTEHPDGTISAFPSIVTTTLAWVSYQRRMVVSYDSRPETYEHIALVHKYLIIVAVELLARAQVHDSSKLEEPELSVFDEYTPRLRDSTYGSEEYKQFLGEMGVALEHHYRINDHHPEHFEHGVGDMNLLQMVEMLCDWKAATLRHVDGDLDRSITQNATRFGYGPEFEGLLRNTAKWMGWL